MPKNYSEIFSEIIKELENKGITLSKINETTWRGEKFGSLFFSVFVDDNGVVSYDSYAELKGGIYETGDLLTLVKYLLIFKETLEKHGAREINTTERLYPANRRGKNTKTSEL